jgi:hypothetical protein
VTAFQGGRPPTAPYASLQKVLDENRALAFLKLPRMNTTAIYVQL